MKRRNHNDKGGKGKNDGKNEGSGEKKGEKPKLDDDCQNQGFSDWLRSTDGVEMMRLFVIANTLLVFITMAWPNMRIAFYALREYFFGEVGFPIVRMLGTIVRGAFLIGILTWYSSSVWRMIDGYFKEQFRSYLEEEYRKNPRMREDVRTAAGKGDPGVSTTTAAPPTIVIASVAPLETLESIIEACQQADTCSAEAAESNQPEKAANEATSSEVVDATGEKGTGSVETSDKNAFLETTRSPQLESDLPDMQATEETIDHRHSEPGIEKSEVSENQPTSTVSTATANLSSSTDTDVHQPAKKNAAKQVRRTVSTGGESAKKSKKRKVRTIFLTEEDFATAKGGKVHDDDFWEFEEDAEEKGAPMGILVSELPFKPRADIGDLDRVSEEEFCPLTLDDESSCGEAVPWP